MWQVIPDDVTFDDEPKEQSTDVDYSSYKPKLFTSTATTTAKVCHAESYIKSELLHSIYNNACLVSAACHRSSWRGMKQITTGVTALCKKFNKDDLLDMDFKAYLASSSEEEEDEEEVEPQTEG